jgi:hypothetical protein
MLTVLLQSYKYVQCVAILTILLLAYGHSVFNVVVLTILLLLSHSYLLYLQYYCNYDYSVLLCCTHYLQYVNMLFVTQMKIVRSRIYIVFHRSLHCTRNTVNTT